MDSKEAQKLTAAVTDARRTLEKAGKEVSNAISAISRELAKAQHPAFGPPLDFALLPLDFPAIIDWENPTINGIARCSLNEHGEAKITVTIPREQAHRFVDLLGSLPVNGILISAVDPE